MFSPYDLYRIRDEILRYRSMSLIFGVLFLSATIWAGGPYLGLGDWYPLRPVKARIMAIGVVVLLALGGWLWQRLRSRKKNRKMAEDLAGPAEGAAHDDSRLRADEEQGRLRERFVEAMQLLRKRRRDGNGLDKLPWYLLIGAPGSGKSTLLQNSGLQFPLQEHFGQQSLPGVGGTRSCDWWFADQAIFLDSAGRYTTQDSDAKADAAAWKGFLDLLRRYRKRPLNGVIVTVSASDLLDPDDNVRAAHARAVRRRLEELDEKLRATVPVYLVITKADLISGFQDFFADLDAKGRSQVWGVSFPHDQRDRALEDPVALFPRELDLLLDRVDAEVIDRLHAGRDPQRRASMLSFPQQLRLLQPALLEFVASAFSGHGYAEKPWLRGVYLTSGTQEGHSIDRVMSSVARHFGITSDALPAPLDKPRTFFVSRLLKDVMFAEAGLAGGFLRHLKQWKALQLAAWAVLTLGTLLLLWGMVGSYTANAQLIADVKRAVDQYPEQALRRASNERQYYVAALQRFDVLAQARALASPPGKKPPLSQRLGLHQGSRLADAINDAYLRDLNGVLLPAFAESVRDRLEQAGNEPQQLYQLLKGYLMLGYPDRREAGQLLSLASSYWRQLFPKDPRVRQALEQHLRALFADTKRARALPLDQQQVERTRATLQTAQVGALVYGALKLAQVPETPRQALRLDRRLGLLGDVFERRSGTPLSEPLPSMFTRKGFQVVAGGGIDKAVQDFLADDWVLGTTPQDALGKSQLAREVLALYQGEYIAYWEGLLDDLQLKPVTDMGNASAVAAKLGGAGSPLKALLEVVKENTSGLAVPEEQKKAAGGGASADDDTSKAATAEATLPENPIPEGAAEPIERHFEPINQVSDSAGGSSALDQTLGTLTDMSRILLTTSAGAGVGTEQNDPALLIAAQQAEQLPAPINGWVASLAGTSRNLVANSAGKALRQGQRQAAGQDCALFVRGRYPFVPSSSSDIPLRDFAELLGPGGRFDRFFQQALASKANTGGQAWKWNDGVRNIGAPEVLQRAQLASQIQQAFFAGGSAQAKVDAVVTVSGEQGIGRILVDIDGQSIQAQGGGNARQQITWPGPQPGHVRIAAWSESGAALPTIEYRGEWALFRALQAGGLRSLGDLNYQAVYPMGNARVRIDVQPSSLRHPFGSTMLQRFKCP